MERVGPAGGAGPVGYVEAVQRAGGVVVMLVPDPVLVEEPQRALELIDGLMLAGGADIDPADLWAPGPPGDPRHRARARRLRGGARARGDRARHAGAGHLSRHAADQRRLRRHARAAPARALRPSRAPARGRVLRRRRPRRAPERGLAGGRAAGELLHATKSHHHQGVDRVGEGLVVSGVSTLDELPEAIELPDRPASCWACSGIPRPTWRARWWARWSTRPPAPACPSSARHPPAGAGTRRGGPEERGGAPYTPRPVRLSRAIRATAWGMVVAGVAAPLVRKRVSAPPLVVQAVAFGAPLGLCVAVRRSPHARRGRVRAADVGVPRRVQGSARRRAGTARAGARLLSDPRRPSARPGRAAHRPPAAGARAGRHAGG